VYMRIDFLNIKEDSRQRRGEVEGCVGGVIGAEDEGVCEIGRGEVWVEKELIVNVGGI
jgi:hypothetical protein